MTYLIVGVGLIGGSLGLALSQRAEVLGLDADPEAITKALELGAITRGIELGEEIRSADLVLIATPPLAVIPTLERILPFIQEDALVLDLASTKGAITQRAWELLGPRFIGGHPMAGSERGGVGAADPYLFENAPFILCLPQEVSSRHRQLAEDLVSGLGAVPLFLSPGEHDQIVGMVSHLPHLCAVALLETLADLPQRQQAMELAAGGFRDLTRIASGNPKLWQGILASNRWVVAELLELFEEKLAIMRALLASGEPELEPVLAHAQKVRSELPARRKGLLGSSFELVLALPDRPGAIAEATGVLAAARLNIQDLEILRVREGEGGTVMLSFAQEETRERAFRELEAKGFAPVLRGA